MRKDPVWPCSGCLFRGCTDSEKMGLTGPSKGDPKKRTTTPVRYLVCPDSMARIRSKFERNQVVSVPMLIRKCKFEVFPHRRDVIHCHFFCKNVFWRGHQKRLFRIPIILDIESLVLKANKLHLRTVFRIMTEIHSKSSGIQDLRNRTF